MLLLKDGKSLDPPVERRVDHFDQEFNPNWGNFLILLDLPVTCPSSSYSIKIELWDKDLLKDDYGGFLSISIDISFYLSNQHALRHHQLPLTLAKGLKPSGGASNATLEVSFQLLPSFQSLCNLFKAHPPPELPRFDEANKRITLPLPQFGPDVSLVFEFPGSNPYALHRPPPTQVEIDWDWNAAYDLQPAQLQTFKC